MNDLEIRKEILQKLCDIDREHGPGAGFSAEELSKSIPAAIADINFHIRDLCDRRYIRNITRFVVCIRPEGRDYLMELCSPSVAVEPVQQKIEISGGSVGQINQGHVINNPSLFWNQLAEVIEKNPDIEPEKKKEWCKTIWEISKHPVLTEAVKTLLSRCL
ncbi:MAG TPA: hypothetical protein P5244_14760 [Syntrophales bacterium]|nr:hypothetical protein [Syntrophales bacterium]